MRTLPLFLLLLSTLSRTFAQSIDSREEWHPGRMQLVNGQELSGDIHYETVTELVQLRTQEKISTFSARQVQSFYYTDRTFSLLREFVALQFSSAGELERPVFLEVILKGNLPLFRRHHNRSESFHNTQVRRQASQYRHFDYTTGFSYFIYHHNQFVQIREFKKNVLPLLYQDLKTQMQQIIRQRRLRLFKLEDQVWLISYYNQAKLAFNSLENLSGQSFSGGYPSEK